uniref:Uncharacterized protein n=1 Tax=Brassica oleracea TaxID=3712 RepID=A0A3P6FUS8_BRAOL|nr:unnamed protein product [Brassica oleracea]
MTYEDNENIHITLLAFRTWPLMYVEELKLMETVFTGIDKQYQRFSNFGLYDKLLKNNSRSKLPAWKMNDNDIV